MRKFDQALEKVKQRIDECGFIFGSISKLSELLDIPPKTLKKVIESGQFTKYTIRCGKITYYMLTNKENKHRKR